MKWSSTKELAEAIIAKAAKRKNVTLSPETAHLVGLKLMSADARPTRDEVARLLCSSKCQEPCYSCRGQANSIVNVYGQKFGLK